MTAFVRWSVVFFVLFTLIIMSETGYSNPPGMKAPWRAGETYRCNQGNFGTFSHNDVFALFAWDFGLPMGTPVLAAADGIVTFTGYASGGYGNHVLIKHASHTSSVYGHFSAVSVSVGQRVKQGQIIGTAGNTGNATAPHLHFSILDRKGYSLPSRFADIGIPVEGLYYTSENGCQTRIF